MAQEVIINYATRSIDAALRKLGQTKKLADEAARKIKNAVERRLQLARNRADYLAGRDRLQTERRSAQARDELEARASSLQAARAVEGGIDARAASSLLNTAREVGGAAAAGNVAALATKLGPWGALAAAVYAVLLKPLQDEADRQFERWRLEQEANLRATLAERFQTFEDRIRADPVFRQRQAELGAQEAVARGEQRYKHERSAAIAGLD